MQLHQQFEKDAEIKNKLIMELAQTYKLEDINRKLVIGSPGTNIKHQLN